MLNKFIFNLLLLNNHRITVNAHEASSYIIASFNLCEDVPNQRINLTFKPKTFTYPQVLDVALITPISLGNQLKYIRVIEIQDKLVLRYWQHLVVLEDDFCRALQIYGGPLAYNIHTAMGILPIGVCPIPKGNYHAVNYTIDYNLMKFVKAFLLGRFRVTSKYVEKSTKHICIILWSTTNVQ